MQTEVIQLNCPGKDWSVYRVKIDEKVDADLISDWNKRANNLNMNPRSPNGELRDFTEIERTRYMGLASEELCLKVLKELVDDGFVSKKFENYDDHVDISYFIGDREEYAIEIRSSFPRKSITWAVCQGFDIIGPYSTTYKNRENVKNLYLRVLFKMTGSLLGEDAIFDFRRTHYMYIVASADRRLFDAMGRSTNFKQGSANYRVLKPITNGYDFSETIKVIRSAIGSLGK